MGEAYKGLTIRLGADTTDLQRHLRYVNSALGSTQSEIRKLARALKLDPGNVEAAAQKMGLLESRAAQAYSKLRTLREAERQLGSGGVAELASQTRDAELAAKSALAQYNRVTDALARVKASMRAAAGYDLFESGDVDAQVRQLQQAGKVSESLVADYRRLRAAWQEAFEGNEAAKQVASLRSVQREIARTEAEARGLVTELSSMRSASPGAAVSDGMRRAQAAARQAEEAAASLEAELRQVDEALRFEPGNAQAAAAKVRNLAEQASVAEARLQALNDQAAAFKSKGIDDTGEDMGVLAARVAEASHRYEELTRDVARARGEVDSLSEAMRAVGASQGTSSAE